MVMFVADVAVSPNVEVEIVPPLCKLFLWQFLHTRMFVFLEITVRIVNLIKPTSANQMRVLCSLLRVMITFCFCTYLLMTGVHQLNAQFFLIHAPSPPLLSTPT